MFLLRPILEGFEKSRSGLTLQVRLIDRFGDNGMISVVVCRTDGADWLIDTWLMSCRVLNRSLEQTTLNFLVSRAREAGVRALIGEYLQTERNGMVKDHYAGSASHRLKRAFFIPTPLPPSPFEFILTER